MRAETGLAIEGLVIRPYGPTLLPATTLDVPRGSSLALLGDAGSGKSTVLETLADRRPPNAGTVRLDGLPLRADRIGYAEQQHQLPDGMTAAEHLMVPLLASGIPLRDGPRSRRCSDASAFRRRRITTSSRSSPAASSSASPSQGPSSALRP